jgi:hypothetical protein
MSVLRISYTDAEWAGGAAGLLFIFLPVILASYIAMLVGIVLSIRLWRHWPLIALAVLSVLHITETITGYGSTAFQNAVPVAYGVGVAAISGMWFLVLRSRSIPPVVPR